MRHGVLRGSFAKSGVYEGQLRGLRRHGQGTWRGCGGEVYTGAWEEDHWSGHGTLTTPCSSYTGGFARSKRHGAGTWVGPLEERYEGEWAAGPTC